MMRSQSRRHRLLTATFGALVVSHLGGCNTGTTTGLTDDGTDGSGSNNANLGPGLGQVGEELPVGDGTTVFIDPNDGGTAPEVHLADMFWGRLVNIHAEGADGPVHQSYIVGQDITDNTEVDDDNDPTTPAARPFSLSTDPITGIVNLAIAAPKGTPAYLAAFARLHEGLEPVFASSPSGLGPFTLVARNSALVMRADDLLSPETIIEGQSIRILTGNPPSTPFTARVFPDPNFGQLFRDSDGNGNKEFRPTRIVVDFTISSAELPLTNANGPNNVGLPASPNQQLSNVAIVIPTLTNNETGVFEIVRNLAGNVFAALPQGPQLDQNSPTKPLVAGFRSGRKEDPFNGFLLDETPPRFLGQLDVTVRNVRCASSIDCTVDPEHRYRMDIEYQDAFCETLRPEAGDLMELPGGLLGEVLEDADTANAGVFEQVLVRDVTTRTNFISATNGNDAILLVPFEPLELDADKAQCFLSFSPSPGASPALAVNPTSLIDLRFSEPMDPASISALEDILVVTTDDEAVLAPEHHVVATIIPDNNLTRFSYKPVLPFNHINGVAEPYFVRLGQREAGLTDLAGNRIVNLLPDFIEFALDENAPTDENGGFVLRFNTPDLNEDPLQTVTKCDGPEINGQFIFDDERGVIRARPVTRYSMIVDRDNPTVNVMDGLPLDPNFLFGIGPTVYDNGTKEPMVGTFGSRTMSMWRYCDMGLSVGGQAPDSSIWSLTDSTFYNVDVEGLSWAAQGAVNIDHFDRFEIALAHSSRFPDEGFMPFPTLLPYDLLIGGETSIKASAFKDNALPDGTANPLKIVHERNLGYTINPLNSFSAATGSLMMPYPLNEGANPNDYKYYTWRDTAIQALGGEGSVGQNIVFGGGFFPYAGIGLPPQVLLYQANDPSAPPADWSDRDPKNGAPPGFPADVAATFCWQGGIPSIAMPLLMDFRCFPDSGAGNNNPAVAHAGGARAMFSLTLPRDFRITATGGVDVNGATRKVNPDPTLTPAPSGGFNTNPATSVSGIPFGAPTDPKDALFYLGQLDLLTRISRVHTRFFDTRGGNVTFLSPVTFPAPEAQPTGTSIQFAYRRADTVNANFQCLTQELNGETLFTLPPTPLQSAEFLNAYGDQQALVSDADLSPFQPTLADTDFVPYGNPANRNLAISFTGGDATWTTSLDDLAGAPFIQTRMTFVANPISGVTPELDAIGWVFDFAD